MDFESNYRLVLPKRLVNVSSQEQEKAQPFSRLCGSPEYMAPEVIRADRKKKRGYGPKCDIWSLFLYIFDIQMFI